MKVSLFDKNKKNKISEFNGNNGFTLIEAIVTIAIVGVVIGPIAMIFQGALLSSIEAREQLRANQLSQQYVESLKIMTYEDIVSLNDDVFDGARSNPGEVLPTDISSYYLPNTTTNFDVFIKLVGDSDADYNSGISSPGGFDSENFKMPTDFSASTTEDYDIYLRLDSASNNGFKLYNDSVKYVDGVAQKTFTDIASVDREIEIRVEKSLDLTQYKYTIIHLNSGVSAANATFQISAASARKKVVIYCDDELAVSPIKSDIEIQNSSGEMVSIFLYRKPADKINPNLNIGYGPVRIVDTDEIKIYSHRLYEVEVVVKKDGEILESIITTVLAK